MSTLWRKQHHLPQPRISSSRICVVDDHHSNPHPLSIDPLRGIETDTKRSAVLDGKTICLGIRAVCVWIFHLESGQYLLYRSYEAESRHWMAGCIFTRRCVFGNSAILIHLSKCTQGTLGGISLLWDSPVCLWIPTTDSTIGRRYRAYDGGDFICVSSTTSPPLNASHDDTEPFPSKTTIATTQSTTHSDCHISNVYLKLRPNKGAIVSINQIF